MRVWLLEHGFYVEGTSVLGVFSSEEKALEAEREFNKGTSDSEYTEVSEWVVQ